MGETPPVPPGWEEWARRYAEDCRRASDLLERVGGPLRTNPTLRRLRVLTVVCPAQHQLVTAYRISGELVCEGSTLRNNPQMSGYGPRGAFMLASDTPGDVVFSGCACGQQAIAGTWLREQVANAPGTPHRRVVHA